MNIVFYISSAVAILASAGVVASRHAVHALLYLVVSLLAIATIFYIMGAPFAAALEVIVYAGAILVLFVFAIMLLGLTAESMQKEHAWLRWKLWPGPLALGGVLAGELVCVLLQGGGLPHEIAPVGARQVSAALFGPYALGVELASLLLLGGLLGAYNLIRPGAGGSEDAGAATVGDGNEIDTNLCTDTLAAPTPRRPPDESTDTRAARRPLVEFNGGRRAVGAETPGQSFAKRGGMP